DLLRAGDGALHHRRADDGRIAVACGHRAGAVLDGADRPGADPRMVRVHPAGGVPHLHDHRLRRDQPRALRPARGRSRAGGGLPHRVLEHEVVVLLPRRVHEHPGDLLDRGHPVPGRLERPVAARPLPIRLVPAQSAGAGVRVHLGALDIPAAALRPAYGLRLEGAAPGVAAQHRRHRRGDLVEGARVTPFLFAGLAAVLLVSAVLVILQRSPVASALWLVLAFCALAGIYLLLQAEFIGLVQIIVYAGAIMV